MKTKCVRAKPYSEKRSADSQATPLVVVGFKASCIGESGPTELEGQKT